MDEIYPNAVELCSISIDGSSIYIPTSEMNRYLYESFRISPNSHTVEFLSDLVETGFRNLVQAPINRDYYQWWNQLDGWLVEGGNVGSWKYGPGGNYVIYAADQVVDEKFELYVTFDGIFLPLVRR